MSSRLVLATLVAACLAAAPAEGRDWPWQETGRRFTVLPLMGFSSDDGVGGGARLGIYDYDGKTAPYRRGCTFQAFFTSRGNWNHEVALDFPGIRPGCRLEFELRYDREGRANFFGDLTDAQIQDFTFDQQTYRQDDIYLRSVYVSDLVHPWHVVFGIRTGRTDITPHADSGTVLETLAPVGANGGTIVELNAAIRFDTRDDYLNATRGIMDELSLVYAYGAGGDFNGWAVQFEHRHFIPLSESFIVAQRAMLTWTLHDMPFYEQPKLGSSRTLRGLSADRYRDEGRALVNTELRWLGVPIIPRYQVYGGLNLFTDLGQVYPRTDVPSFTSWEYGMGVGLRLYWYSTIARGDIGFSRDGTGIYMRFSQIF